MKARTPFSYVVLRYMHDVFTREFVNVGVLLHAPATGFIGFAKLPALDRVKGMFPGLQSDSLRELLNFLASRADELRAKTADLLDRNQLSAESIARTMLTSDDSALQWSDAGGGITDNPEKTLNELSERLVEYHLKARPVVRREDADIWRPFEREFRQRRILSRLQERTLVVGKLKHTFETAWQPERGYLRLYQPLSFDLVDSSKIVEKAIRWKGLIRELRKANPDFFVYLLLGQPADGERMEAFLQARETLDEDGEKKRLIPEEKAPEFAIEVEQEMKSAA
jgi:hypothetical protein